MAGQPMKASEVLIKKDSRHGSTVVTYHDKKMTVPIKTSQDNDQSHSVLMNAESSCSQCSEPITASLGRRKRKVIVRSASSDDTKHVKTNGILNGDNGYVTLDGKRRQCHWDSDPPARQNVGSTRDMDGHLEETKVQMIIPSGASSNAIMDVIIKARNMASDRKFYDPSAPDVDHTSYLDIDEALRDDRFTDEFKDAVEELRMVPFIKIRCPEFPAVTWPRQSPPKSPPEKNSLETSDYETLEKQKPDKHKMNHSKYSRSTHSTQSERIDVRSTSGTTTAHTVPRYPKNSTTRNDFHDVKHNKASPLLQLKPVRYKPVQLQPHVTSKEPHNGNNYSKLTTDRILTLSPSDGNSSRDNCQTPPDKHCGQVKHDHREASTGRSAETIILDNLVIPDYNANIEDSFRASMEDVFEHELSMVERRKLSLRDSCHSSSPDSLVEKILDDVDSEVYDESAKLNRIFSVRSDETTTNKPQESGNESANDISPVDSISTSSAEANDTIDHELDVSLEDALHDFEEVLQYSGRPEHRSSDSSPETIGTDTVKPGHLGNPLQQIINSSYQLHFSVNDSTEELFEDVMESMAAIEEEDEEVDGSMSGEYDTEDGRVVLNTPRSSDASDLQNGNSVLHKSPNSSCEALLGDRTQSIDMPNGIREEAGGNASDDVSVDFTLSGGSSDNLLDCDRRVTYDEFKSDTVDFTELLQSLDDKSEISSHGVNQTSGHTLHTDVSISRNRTLLRDSRTSSSGGVVEETFSDNGTNYITETVDLNVVPDHPISPLAVTKNFDFTSSNQQTIVRKTTVVTSVPSSHKVLTDVTQSPSSIVNPTSTKPKKIPPPVPPRKYKPKVIAEVSHPRLAVTVPEHKLVEQPRIDPVTEPSLPTHYTDSFYEGRIPLPTSPSVEYAPRILRVQDDNNMAKSNDSTSHRESEIKYGTSGECDTFRISRKEEKDVEFLVKTDMVDQCNIDNDKLKERSGNDEHEELLDNEGSVGSLLDKEIQQCISSTSRSGSSSGSESDVESGNDCLETDDVCEDDIFGSGITGDPQTNRRSGLPSEGDTLKQAHEAANIINHLFVQRCIREEMCDGDVSSSLIDDEEEEVIGRDYPPYDTTTTDEASDTSITSDNEANRDSVNVTETETRPCLNENVTSELTHCLQDICQSSEPIPSDGVVLSEEVITQEIAFVISVPTKKKKKKHKRNKKDKDVVKKGDPARSLHLHRVTRLTDLDVELMGGSKLKSLADTPSSGTHREENSRVLSPESLGEDKIPLDESLEQHAHDQRMPVVVEVRGHHSSSSLSGPLTPNSIGSPYSSKCNTPRQSPGASSKSPEFSDRMSSRTSSVDSLGQEMRGSNSVDSGEDRPPSRGLRSPLSPVPVEVEFEQKESSQSTEVANLSNSPVNIQREDSLKIMQVPHTTDAFLGSLQETVSKMSSLLLRGIAFNKDLQVKIGCEASETYLPRPDSASVQTLTVSDTIVDTTAHNALTQGSAQDEEKESSRDLCTVPSGEENLSCITSTFLPFSQPSFLGDGELSTDLTFGDGTSRAMHVFNSMNYEACHVDEFSHTCACGDGDNDGANNVVDTSTIDGDDDGDDNDDDGDDNCTSLVGTSMTNGGMAIHPEREHNRHKEKQLSSGVATKKNYYSRLSSPIAKTSVITPSKKYHPRISECLSHGKTDNGLGMRPGSCVTQRVGGVCVDTVTPSFHPWTSIRMTSCEAETTVKAGVMHISAFNLVFVTYSHPMKVREEDVYCEAGRWWEVMCIYVLMALALRGWWAGCVGGGGRVDGGCGGHDVDDCLWLGDDEDDFGRRGEDDDGNDNDGYNNDTSDDCENWDRSDVEDFQNGRSDADDDSDNDVNDRNYDDDSDDVIDNDSTDRGDGGRDDDDGDYSDRSDDDGDDDDKSDDYVENDRSGNDTVSNDISNDDDDNDIGDDDDDGVDTDGGDVRIDGDEEVDSDRGDNDNNVVCDKSDNDIDCDRRDDEDVDNDRSDEDDFVCGRSDNYVDCDIRDDDDDDDIVEYEVDEICILVQSRVIPRLDKPNIHSLPPSVNHNVSTTTEHDDRQCPQANHNVVTSPIASESERSYLLQCDHNGTQYFPKSESIETNPTQRWSEAPTDRNVPCRHTISYSTNGLESPNAINLPATQCRHCMLPEVSKFHKNKTFSDDQSSVEREVVLRQFHGVTPFNERTTPSCKPISSPLVEETLCEGRTLPHPLGRSRGAEVRDSAEPEQYLPIPLCNEYLVKETQPAVCSESHIVKVAHSFLSGKEGTNVNAFDITGPGELASSSETITRGSDTLHEAYADGFEKVIDSPETLNKRGLDQDWHYADKYSSSTSVCIAENNPSSIHGFRATTANNYTNVNSAGLLPSYINGGQSRVAGAGELPRPARIPSLTQESQRLYPFSDEPAKPDDAAPISLASCGYVELLQQDVNEIDPLKLVYPNQTELRGCAGKYRQAICRGVIQRELVANNFLRSSLHASLKEALPLRDSTTPPREKGDSLLQQLDTLLTNLLFLTHSLSSEEKEALAGEREGRTDRAKVRDRIGSHSLYNNLLNAPRPLNQDSLDDGGGTSDVNETCLREANVESKYELCCSPGGSYLHTPALAVDRVASSNDIACRTQAIPLQTTAASSQLSFSSGLNLQSGLNSPHKEIPEQLDSAAEVLPDFTPLVQQESRVDSAASSNITSALTDSHTDSHLPQADFGHHFVFIGVHVPDNNALIDNATNEALSLIIQAQRTTRQALVGLGTAPGDVTNPPITDEETVRHQPRALADIAFHRIINMARRRGENSRLVVSDDDDSTSGRGTTDEADYEDEMDDVLDNLKVIYPSRARSAADIGQGWCSSESDIPHSSLTSTSARTWTSVNNVSNNSTSDYIPLTNIRYSSSRTARFQPPTVSGPVLEDFECFGVKVLIPKTPRFDVGGEITDLFASSKTPSVDRREITTGTTLRLDDHSTILERKGDMSSNESSAKTKSRSSPKLPKKMPRMRDVILQEVTFADADTSLESVQLSGTYSRQVDRHMKTKHGDLRNNIQSRLTELLEVIDEMNKISIRGDDGHIEGHDSSVLGGADGALVEYYIFNMTSQLKQAVSNSVKRKLQRQLRTNQETDGCDIDHLLTVISDSVVDILFQTFEKAKENVKERSKFLSAKGLEVPSLLEMLFYDERKSERRYRQKSYDIEQSCQDILEGSYKPSKRKQGTNVPAEDEKLSTSPTRTLVSTTLTKSPPRHDPSEPIQTNSGNEHVVQSMLFGNHRITKRTPCLNNGADVILTSRTTQRLPPRGSRSSRLSKRNVNGLDSMLFGNPGRTSTHYESYTTGN